MATSPPLTKALEYLDTVIDPGREFTEQELKSTDVVPYSRCFARAEYSFIHSFIPNGEKLLTITTKNLLSSMKTIGLVIADAKTTYHMQASEIACVYARFLFESGNIASDMIVLCLDSNCIKKVDPKQMGKYNIVVLYDESNKTGISPRFETSLLGITPRGMVSWAGDVPNIIKKKKTAAAQRGNKEAVSSHLKTCLSNILVYNDVLDSIAMFMSPSEKALSSSIAFVNAISYGNINLSYLKNVNVHVIQNVDHSDTKWLEENVVYLKQEDFEDETDNLSQPDYDEIRDIVSIWSHFLADFGKWKIEDKAIDPEGIKKFGKLIGVDSAISAYYNGVPLSDLLL